MKKNIIVLGDSIAWGAWDKEEGGWVNRLKKHLDNKALSLEKNFLLYNLAVSGHTSQDLLKIIEKEIENRIHETHKTLPIIAIGINDSQLSIKSLENKISIETFENNINQIIEKLKAFSKEIVFLGLTYVDESKIYPIPWKKTHGYLNKEIEKYNRIIKTCCQKENINFIEILNAFSKNNYLELLNDGLHPNERGHELIFQIVKEYIENKNFI